MLRHAQLLAKSELPEPYSLGLAQARWPGRAQVVLDSDSCAPAEERCSNLTFHLDGAHTGESAATCAEWFAGAAQAGEAAQAVPSERVLVFNCMKARRRRAALSSGGALTSACAVVQEREPKRLLTPLISGLHSHGARSTRAALGLFWTPGHLTVGVTAHRSGLQPRHLCACRPSRATG